MEETTNTIRVRLPESLGVKRCGPYEAGVEYDVETVEAERLITVKRFERVGVSNSDEEL